MNTAVIGGGVSGIRAALTLARAGHAVTLAEKNQHLGGRVFSFPTPDFGETDIGQHVTLYDGSAIPSLPTATVDQMLVTLDNPAVRAIWARKVAFVATTATARMQIKRLQQIRPDICVFDDRETAIAWLVEP